jgi:hypothetical protein
MITVLLLLASLLFGSAPTSAPQTNVCSDDPSIVQTGTGTGG